MTAVVRALVVLMALFAPAAHAAPAAEAWARWRQHDEQATAVLDHGAWARFLSAYRVAGDDGIARVAYGRVTTADRAALAAYVAGLEAVAVSGLNRAEQKAYWINLYNALTVRVVLDHYPVESIRDIDISPGFFADGPWGAKLLRIEGEAVGLDDIEHRILRPLWQDPRVHYALNCASLGCPDLASAPFTSAQLDAQLDGAAGTFVNHPRGARVDDAGRLVVSSLYRWFRADFGGDEGVVAHLRRFAAPALTRVLAGKAAPDDDAYDWALNDAR